MGRGTPPLHPRGGFPGRRDASPEDTGRPARDGDRSPRGEAPQHRAAIHRPGPARPDDCSAAPPPRVERPPAPALRGRPAAAPRDRRPAFASEARDEAPFPRPAPPQERPEPGTLWLHGLHAVAAALRNPHRRLKRLLLTAEAEAALAERLPPPWKLAAERVGDRTRFHTFLPEDAVHQGAALLVHALASARLEDALAASPGPVLLLDQVTDPRNVGAILRSAAAFGAAAVVMQDRHAPPETGALARAASGALESVPVVREVNLSRVILLLQKRGAWVMGLAGEAPRSLAAATDGLAGRRAALVLGAEDAGLRRLQRETCDELVRLPMAPGVESLNVAAAAAVALYELARGRD